MTLREFIVEHREEIDAVIRQNVPNAQYFNDKERRLWVLNDPSLYRMAQQAGVRI